MKNRCVDIMTTGVHGPRNLGLIWKIIFLFDRERIDVCAEGDAWSRFLSLMMATVLVPEIPSISGMPRDVRVLRIYSAVFVS